MFTTEEKKMIALSSLGGALEYYDFAIFAFLVKVLEQLFFPAVDPAAALMATLAVFAVGYLARPIGGILFGHFGDKAGRKKTFVVTVFLMALPTFLIGCLPTYQSFGLAAAVLLIILRIFQGLAVGGELPGAVVFIAETVNGNRGFATGLILFGVNMGMLAGSFVGAWVAQLPPDKLLSWGWRLPFWLGGVLGILSVYLRKRLHETPLFKVLKQNHASVKRPFLEVVTHFPKPLLQNIAIVALQAIIISLFYLFMPTYLATYYHYSLAALLKLNTISILIFVAPVLFLSWLSDKVGRKILTGIGITYFILGSYPVFLVFSFQHFNGVVLALIISYLFNGFIAACFPCMSAELFPTQVRYTGVALAYNIGFGIIGGLVPFITNGLIHITHDRLAPSFVIIAAALIAAIALFTVPETYQRSLKE